MDTVIIWSAQYLIWLMAAVFAMAWLLENRSGRRGMVASAVIALALTAAFLLVAKNLHHNPRPFVRDPSITPLFAHGTDDGFPSNHAAAAGLIAGLVVWRNRMIGLGLCVSAGVVAWGRVAGHVHHLQDVLAGLALGGLAAALASVVAPVILTRLGALQVPATKRQNAHYARQRAQAD